MGQFLLSLYRPTRGVKHKACGLDADGLILWLQTCREKKKKLSIAKVLQVYDRCNTFAFFGHYSLCSRCIHCYAPLICHFWSLRSMLWMYPLLCASRWLTSNVITIWSNYITCPAHLRWNCMCGAELKWVWHPCYRLYDLHNGHWVTLNVSLPISFFFLNRKSCFKWLGKYIVNFTLYCTLLLQLPIYFLLCPWLWPRA